jgi:hypothetical protein
MEANHALALRVVVRLGRIQPSDFRRRRSVRCGRARETLAGFGESRHARFNLAAVDGNLNAARCFTLVCSRA